MPFTTHELEEIREGNARAHCRRCDQTWTSWNVRSACPGVPVYAYAQTPSYLKTEWALEKERKYPADLEQWDGAYRVLKVPYLVIAQISELATAVNQVNVSMLNFTQENQHRQENEQSGQKYTEICTDVQALKMKIERNLKSR